MGLNGNLQKGKEIFLQVFGVETQGQQIVYGANFDDVTSFSHKIDSNWALLFLLIFCQGLAAGAAGGNGFGNSAVLGANGDGQGRNCFIWKVGAHTEDGHPSGTKAGGKSRV